MRRYNMLALLLITLFAAMLMIGFVPALQQYPATVMVRNVASLGMFGAIILFFLLPKDRKP